MEGTDLLADQYADAWNLDVRGAFDDRFAVRDRHPHEWLLDEVTASDSGPDAEGPTGQSTPRRSTTVRPSPTARPSSTSAAARARSGRRTPTARRRRGGRCSRTSRRGWCARRAPRCRRRGSSGGPAVRLRVADAARLLLVDGVADAVVASQMLYHLPDIDAGIAELRRVLAPGGRLYATTGSEANAAALWEFVSAAADGDVEPLAGGFTAENGSDILARHFDRVERRTFENGVRVVDPDALVAYALSLPPSAGPLSAFERGDAAALREAAAARIEREGAIEWRKDLALFVCEL